MSAQNTFQIYDRIPQLLYLEIPPRSRLYFLEPIGTGTPFTESISSYLTRLAQEHCVTLQNIVMGEIAPVILGDKYKQEMPSKNLSSIFGNSDSKPAINGMRDKTKSLTLALEQLTLRQDLRYLSCLTWQGIIKEKSLFRQQKAWCPKCFEQWQREGKPIYEPLIWSFNEINHCPTHNCRLVEKCSNCDSPQKAIAKYSRLGYCSLRSKKLGSSCQQWLGSHNLDSENKIGDEERQITEGIGELITVAPTLDTRNTRKELIKKLQLIQFWFEREIRQDFKMLVIFGGILEKLKITLGRNSDKPLDLVNLLIPVCKLAKITVAQLIQDDISTLAKILRINLRIGD